MELALLSYSCDWAQLFNWLEHKSVQELTPDHLPLSSIDRSVQSHVLEVLARWAFAPEPEADLAPPGSQAGGTEPDEEAEPASGDGPQEPARQKEGEAAPAESP